MKIYKGLFKSRYPDLKGRDWVRRIEPDDLRVFVDIGNQANDHGKLGGVALVEKRGREHMKKNARLGAIATNILKQWRKQVRDYHYENSNLLEEML